MTEDHKLWVITNNISRDDMEMVAAYLRLAFGSESVTPKDGCLHVRFAEGDRKMVLTYAGTREEPAYTEAAYDYLLRFLRSRPEEENKMTKRPEYDSYAGGQIIFR